MKMIHAIRATAVALVLSFLPSDAKAITYENRDQIDEHIELLNTLHSMGINVQINSRHCGVDKDNDVAGFWSGGQKLFVICQQAVRRSKLPTWNGEILLASDDDLDTIRHEAHHVIQDCMDGKIDGRLDHYISDANRPQFLQAYPDWKENYVAQQYREVGANEHIIQLEIEAWAVADLIDAASINQVLKRECKV